MKANPLTDDVKITVRKPEREAGLAATHGSEVRHVQPSELMRKGGDWLAACREWIQWNLPSGDTVTWGSTTPIRCGVSVKQLEELAAHVASSVMNHPPNDQAQAQPPTATPERKTKDQT